MSIFAFIAFYLQPLVLPLLTALLVKLFDHLQVIYLRVKASKTVQEVEKII